MGVQDRMSRTRTSRPLLSAAIRAARQARCWALLRLRAGETGTVVTEVNVAVFKWPPFQGMGDASGSLRCRGGTGVNRAVVVGQPPGWHYRPNHARHGT